MTTAASTKRRAARAGHGLCVLLLILISTAPARADDTAIGEPLPATPPPPVVVYLTPPVVVWTGGALYELEGLRPLYPARLLCATSPCAVPVGAVVSTDGLVGVTVEARRGVALPLVQRGGGS